MEEITDVDYWHSKKVYKELKRDNRGEYHDLFVQSDTLLLIVYLKILEIYVLKYMNLILLIF